MAIFGTGKVGDGTFYDSINGDEMTAIVREMGFVPELSKDNQGDPVVWFQIEGLKCAIFFYEKAGDRYKSVQFFAGFADKIPLEKVNEWSQKKRYSRVYANDEGHARIEYDLPLAGGVRKEYIVEAIGRWRRLMLSFTGAL